MGRQEEESDLSTCLSSSSTDNDDASRSLYYPPSRNDTNRLGETRPFEEEENEELVVLQEANSTASSLDVQVDDIIYDIEDVMMLSVAPPADNHRDRVDGEGGDLEVILGT